MIKAIIFDMDGVITDTEKYYYQSWPKAFADFGYPQFTKENALEQRSLNHKDATIFWKKRFGEELDFDKIHARANEYVKKCIDTYGIPAKPGIKPLLTELKKANLLCAVATASKPERAKERLSYIGVYDEFDAVVSAHTVKQGKPHPDVYLYACKKIGVSPSQCIAVEDSPNGIYSATSAGCKTIMVPDLTQPDQELSALLYACIPSLYDMIPMIPNFLCDEPV